jgi:hypothetical protein
VVHDGVNSDRQTPAESSVVGQVVTVIMGTVVGLTFLFGFWQRPQPCSPARRACLGRAARRAGGGPVDPWVAVGHKALGARRSVRGGATAGSPVADLRERGDPGLDVADPLVAGEFGKAAFDAVGPLLLIGCASSRSEFLAGDRAAAARASDQELHDGVHVESVVRSDADEPVRLDGAVTNHPPQGRQRMPHQGISDDLLEQARREDAAHRATHQKPVSAETLRTRLGIGATRTRHLVKVVRAEYQAPPVREQADSDAAIVAQRTSTPLEGAGRFG